eukprot:NODE_97_length_21155_cov_0.234850.p20 type:complete len:114 gc:universal NODE_97_length_21155_cov_0.234850:11974-11633(-)
MIYPKLRDGNKFCTHFSNSVTAILNLGLIHPHLFNLPFNWITILPDLLSSISSNSSIYPCFCITSKNLITTFDEGLTRTCLLPLRDAFTIVFKVSFNTESLISDNFTQRSYQL